MLHFHVAFFAARKGVVGCHSRFDYISMETDNEKLLCLQDEYLRGDKKPWGNLWVSSLEVVKKMISKERAAKGFHLDVSDFDDKAILADDRFYRGLSCLRDSRRRTEYGWYAHFGKSKK